MEVIANKLGIHDAYALACAEEKISKKQAALLFDRGQLERMQAGSFESLRQIHEFLFAQIYDFAGKLRTVNIAKGNFRFVPVAYLAEAIGQIERMPQQNFDQIIEKYVEMNVAHPFREGNGRSMRIWLDLILKKQIGRVVDWRLVDKADYLLAMERSPIKDTEIKHLLKNALTESITDRMVYIKGIDASYAYEGYESAPAE